MGLLAPRDRQVQNQGPYRTLDYARAATEDSFSNTDPVVGKTGGDMDSLWVDMEKGEDAFLGRATIGQVLRNNPDK